MNVDELNQKLAALSQLRACCHVCGEVGACFEILCQVTQHGHGAGEWHRLAGVHTAFVCATCAQKQVIVFTIRTEMPDGEPAKSQVNLSKGI